MIGLWRIYLLFFKMGLFTFGGGYAMLPILKREVVEKQKWITEEELLDYYSIGQCTPGMIAVNAASFIGYKLRRLSGLISATLGVISPSVVIIVSVALILRKYMENPYVQWAFGGVRISVAALIVSTVIDMWKKGVRRLIDYAVLKTAEDLLWCRNIPAVILVVLDAAAVLLQN